MSVLVYTRVVVIISDDALCAALRWVDGLDLPAPTEEEARLALEETGVKIDDAVSERVTECIRSWAEGADREQPFPVARGIPPKDGTPSAVEWVCTDCFPSADDNDETAFFNFRAKTNVRVVRANEIFARLLPQREGREGRNVFGHTLAPMHPGRELKIGENVSVEADGVSLKALVSGHAAIRSGTMSIRELLHLPGNVDFSTGSIHASAVDIEIGGVIRDLFEVRGQRDVVVHGAVEAAVVEAGHDLLVRGGILGRMRGRVRAGRDLVCKFAEETEVWSAQDIHVARDVVNCTVCCGGRFVAPRAPIVGGAIYARGGLEAAVLGSEAAVRTDVFAGAPLEVFGKIRWLEGKIKAQIEIKTQVRAAAAPFAANLKRLTQAQKDELTLLLLRIKTLDRQIEEWRRRQSALLTHYSPPQRAQIIVHRAIHRGVRLRIDDREAGVTQEIKGPMKVQLRKVKNVTELVAFYPSSGSVYILRGFRVTPPPIEDDGSDILDPSLPTI